MAAEPLAARVAPLKSQDIDAVIQLARSIWYAHYPTIISIEQIEYMLGQRYNAEVINAQIASGRSWWDTLIFADEIVGFAAYELTDDPGELKDDPGDLTDDPGALKDDPGELKLDKLYVRYDLRGRGFGSLLMRHVEQRALQLGCLSVYLQVNKHNSSAIEMYKRNGFVVREAAQFDIGNGFVMDDYLMAKPVTNDLGAGA
ncbi:MAG: GNAT family N-acetyltransferase [Betaproteobacteria bacterium]